jgi:uncharacterized protein YxjI
VNDAEGPSQFIGSMASFGRFGHKIHIDDLGTGTKSPSSKRRSGVSFHTYEIYIAGELKGTIKEKFSWFHAKFKVDFMDCMIKGDILDWNYEVLKQDGTSIGLVQRKVSQPP